MCAPGIPVSSEGWEDVRAADPEEGTMEAPRAGAGKLDQSLGRGNPTSLFHLVGRKSVFNAPSLSVFPE